MRTKAYLAELLGTFVLVLVGCGAAVIAGAQIGLFGVALAFGLAVMMMAYTVGPISGGHFNPAVTIGAAVAGKHCWKQVLPYIAAQVIGGILGAGALYLIASGLDGFALGTGAVSKFASNGFGVASPGQYSMIAGAITEIVVTFIFMTVILGTTQKNYPGHMGGLVIGLTLAAMIMVSGIVTNASLNPARSLATAVFEQGIFLKQMWFFAIMPTIGAVLAALLHPVLFGGDETKCCKEGACKVG